MKQSIRIAAKLVLSALLAVLLLPAARGFVLVYGYGGTAAIYRTGLERAGGTVTAFAPSWLDIDSAGSLSAHGMDRALIEELRATGISVTPFLSNHWNRPSGNAALDNTAPLIEDIAAVVAEYRLDGVNVDIQNVNEAYREKYTEFVRALKSRLPDAVISTAVAANPKGWTLGWHGSYDYPALADACDYLMLMAYDESYYNSPPGPVASGSFVENSILYALNQGVPPHQLVLGVPFYGRYWQEGAAVGGLAITGRDVEHLLAALPDAEAAFDEGTHSARAETTLTEPMRLWGGGLLEPGRYVIWYDDALSLAHKFALANQYGLKGVGAWALGQEHDEAWQALRQTLENPLYADIGGHWAERAILLVSEKGWMVGYGGRFRPDDTVTRAEAATILVRLCNLQEAQRGGDYADTEGHWAADEIAIARQHGLMQGVGGNLFHPDDTMTREQLAVLMDRAVSLSDALDFQATPFPDVARADHPWSYDSIVKLHANGILQGGEDGLFRPLSPVRRGELAAVLDRLSGFGTVADAPPRAARFSVPHGGGFGVR